MRNTIAALMCTLGVLGACHTPPLDPDFSRLGYTYFPLDSGMYRDYWVEHIQIPIVGEPDTAQYWLREQVGELIAARTGDTTRVLARYTRTDSLSDWRLDSLWQVRRTPTQGIVIENNVPRLKLLFPIGEGKTWDGNALSVQETQDYTMQALALPYTVAGIRYPNTITVIQSDNSDNIVKKDFTQEIFAENIGMVLREDFQFRYCGDDDCSGQQIIEAGHSYRQLLYRYGQ